MVAIDCDIQDLDALKAACQAMGLEFRENQQTFNWYGTWMADYQATDAAYLRAGITPGNYGKCAHAIGIPGNKDAYEVGVCKRPDGKGYVLLLDFFAGGRGMVDAGGGRACERLTQNYAAKVASKQARKDGWHVTEQITQEGDIRLTCTR